MIKKLHLRYINYLLSSVTKYDVHSPFLYDLITKVFDDKKKYPEYVKVEQLKKELLLNKSIISVTDLGAGSRVNKGNERSVGQIAKSSSKSKKIGRLLFRLVKYYQPGNILELGTSLGLSSLYFALGNPASKIITIEGCPNISNIAAENFKKLSVNNIELFTGNFDDLLPEILKSVKNLDFIFIDGNHRENPTINYFEQCLTKAYNDTVFVFDDIHWSEGMENSWNYIKAHPKTTLTIDLFFVGIVFLKSELSKEDFIIKF